MTSRAASSNLVRVAWLLGVVVISYIPTGWFLMPRHRTPVNRNFTRPQTHSSGPVRQTQYAWPSTPGPGGLAQDDWPRRTGLVRLAVHFRPFSRAERAALFRAHKRR